MSGSVCGSDGLLTRSQDARATTSRTISGGRFRRPRFTPGFMPRRPAESVGIVICGVWAESGQCRNFSLFSDRIRYAIAKALDPTIEGRPGDTFRDAELINAQTARLTILKTRLPVQIVVKTRTGSARFTHNSTPWQLRANASSLPRPTSMDWADAYWGSTGCQAEQTHLA